MARTEDRAPLWRAWAEAAALWARIGQACPGLEALVLMPNHVHLVHPEDVRVRLAKALSGYTRWRDHHRGVRGPRTQALPAAEPLADEGKVRRAVRYVHLNPCRARLCADPLEWPFSTHRDRCGLASPALVPYRSSPDRFHAYVSGDPSVDVRGTELPRPAVQVPDADSVLHAVSAVTRTPLADLRRRGPARTLYLRAARTLTAESGQRIGDLVGVTRGAALSVGPDLNREVKMVRRVIGDPRFPPLWDGELRWGHVPLD